MLPQRVQSQLAPTQQVSPPPGSPVRQGFVQTRVVPMYSGSTSPSAVSFGDLSEKMGLIIIAYRLVVLLLHSLSQTKCQLQTVYSLSNGRCWLPPMMGQPHVPGGLAEDGFKDQQPTPVVQDQVVQRIHNGSVAACNPQPQPMGTTARALNTSR